MAKYRAEDYGMVLFQSFLDALQEYIGSAALNFHLTLASGTSVQVVAGANSAQVGLGIDGLWRYISATVSTSVTGAAGPYDIFAVCGPNDFVSNPSPPPSELDLTVYAFALQALSSGTTPTLSMSVTNFRKVGEVDWDGTKITGFRPLVGDSGVSPKTATTLAAGVVPSRAVGATGQTAPLATWELPSGVLATLTATGGLTLSDTATLAGGGTSTTPPGTSDNSTKIATTAFVQAVVSLYAPLASPALTGTPTAPTVTPTSDATTKLATTAFVHAVVGGLAASQGFINVVPKTANYTVLAADNGSILTFSGASLTATLPATAPGMPWLVAIVNLDTSPLTVSPNGRNLNGGGASIVLAQNQSVIVWSDGSNYAYGSKPPLAFARKVAAVAQSATPSINTDSVDVVSITALAQAITSMTTNLTGTPQDGQMLIVRITDNGTARAIAWGAKFESSGGVALPTTTVAGVMLTVGFEWNTATSAWRCIAVA